MELLDSNLAHHLVHTLVGSSSRGSADLMMARGLVVVRDDLLMDWIFSDLVRILYLVLTLTIVVPLVHSILILPVYTLEEMTDGISDPDLG